MTCYKQKSQASSIFIRGSQQVDTSIFCNQLLNNKLDNNLLPIDTNKITEQSIFDLSQENQKNENQVNNSVQIFSNKICQIKKYDDNQNIILWPYYQRDQEINNQDVLADIENKIIIDKVLEKNKDFKVIMVVDSQKVSQEVIQDIQQTLIQMFNKEQNFDSCKNNVLVYAYNIKQNNDLQKVKDELQKNEKLKDFKVIGYDFTKDINDQQNIEQIKSAIKDLQYTQKFSQKVQSDYFNQQLNEIYSEIRKFMNKYFQHEDKNQEKKYNIEINEIEIAKGCMILLRHLAKYNFQKGQENFNETCKILQKHYQDFKDYILNKFKKKQIEQDEYNELYEDYLKQFVLMTNPYIQDINMKKDLIQFDKEIRQEKFNDQMEYSFDKSDYSQYSEFDKSQHFQRQKQQQTILEDDQSIILPQDQSLENSVNMDENDMTKRNKIENQFLSKVKIQDKLNNNLMLLEECQHLSMEFNLKQDTQQELQNMKKKITNILKQLEIQIPNNLEKLPEILQTQILKNKENRLNILKQCIDLYLQNIKLLLEEKNQTQEERVQNILKIYTQNFVQYQNIMSKKKSQQNVSIKQLIEIIATTQDTQQFKSICDKLQQDKTKISTIIDEQRHSLLYNALLFGAKDIQKYLEENHQVQLNNEDLKYTNQNFCEAVKRYQFDAIKVKIALGHNVNENFNCQNYVFCESLLPPNQSMFEIQNFIDPLKTMISYDNLNALEVAILLHNFEAVKILIEEGKCKVNNEDNQTKLLPPLMISILTGNNEIFDYLYEKCDKEIKANQNDYNLAHIAIICDNVEILKKLDQHYFLEQDNDGYLPLHLAVEITNDFDILIKVLEKTENLNILNKQNQNAVTMAILNYNQLNIIKQLDYEQLVNKWQQKTDKEIQLEYFDEFDLNQPLYDSQTKLDTILDYCKENKDKILDLFQQSQSKIIPYDYAFLKGEHIVNKLIQFDKESGNRLTEDQKNIYSSSREQFIKDFFQKPKIKRQINSGQLKDQIFKIVFDLYKENLGEFSIKNQFQDEQGNTFLHHMVLESMTDLIQEQLENNSPLLETKNKQCETPLFLAVTLQNLECMQILIDKGADVNALNQRKQTPLIVSITDECFESAELLLKQAKINIEIIDEQEQSAENYLDKILKKDYICMKENSLAKAQNLKTKF